LDEIFADGRSLVNYAASPRVFIDEEGNPLDRPEFAIEDFTSDYDADLEDMDLDEEVPF